MNRRNFNLRGGVYLALVLLLGLMLVASLVACGSNEKPESKVVLTPHDATTFFAESYDYTSMFEATVDEKPYEIKAENIDASNVDLDQAGVYDVKCEIEVNNKKYNATAKLTVVAPRDFSVAAKSSETEIAIIGEPFDAASLFSATVATQPYTLNAEDIDISNLDLAKEGLYEITASLTNDGVTKTATKKIYVISAANYDISGAMQYKYANYSAKITVEEDDNGNKATEYITVKDAEGKYHYESRLPLSNGGETHDIYEFQLDAETGYPSNIYHFNNTEEKWEKKGADMQLYAYVNHVEADEDFAQYFSLDEDGMFVASANKSKLTEIASSLLCYNTSLIGDVTLLKVRVENNKIAKIVVESKYESGEDYYDTYLITVELDDFGTVEFELPYFEPVVEITPANAEVYVGDETEYDFLSMFTIKVDGHSYTLGEGDEYSIEQSVDFNKADVYDVTLKLTVKEGREEHTATAKLTVKEKPTAESNFRTAMEAMIANCTMTKYKKTSATSGENVDSTFLVDGNATYKQSNNTLYDTSITDGNKTQQYTVQDGVAVPSNKVNGSFLRLCDLTPIIDEFEKGEDGKTYTYTGDRLRTLFLYAGVIIMDTAATQEVSIEVVFENGAIQTIKLNYKSNKTSKDILYHLYTISAIGSTVLPVQLPTA